MLIGFLQNNFRTRMPDQCALISSPERDAVGSETSLDLDSDWNEDAEEELRSIESSYAVAKRKSSGFNIEESSSQRRRLPGWVSAASPSGCVENGDLISKLDRSPCPRNLLSNFSPIPCQANLKARHQVFTFGGRVVYSRTSSEVEQSTKEILDKIEHSRHNADEISLGFDLEWKPNFIKGKTPNKTAVLQICMDWSDCYIMHIIHSGIPPMLKSLLEDPSSFKVGIGIANDAAKISSEHNIHVASLVDLSRFANLKLGGASKNWGLSSLMEMLTCKQLSKSKKIRMGNWEARELSKNQLHYAATDAFASWYLYQILKTFPDPKPKT
ncbi:Werner Syndrome-like exonuclease [Phalaenopsis equestris]|uniref:Werner Syndrome-like exonuclease n=1 Tax=Phalaenopsis equestris TaxID=78828 RepID=UPI0009E40603|nr:Werner Syndrome-like exonuclease [Phalaenopsis equestris]